MVPNLHNYIKTLFPVFIGLLPDALIFWVYGFLFKNDSCYSHQIWSECAP